MGSGFLEICPPFSLQKRNENLLSLFSSLSHHLPCMQGAARTFSKNGFLHENPHRSHEKKEKKAENQKWNQKWKSKNENHKLMSEGINEIKEKMSNQKEEKKKRTDLLFHSFISFANF